MPGRRGARHRVRGRAGRPARGRRRDRAARGAAFLELIERTSEAVFWLCAVAHTPYAYLCFVRRGADVFRVTITLPPWREQDIAELLRARTAASGYTPSYDDLVIDEVGSHEREAYLRSTEQDYMRRLWDYAEGSPRVAIHYWLLSLAPEGKRRVRVRLFRGPDEDQLEGLGERVLQAFCDAGVAPPAVLHRPLPEPEPPRRRLAVA